MSDTTMQNEARDRVVAEILAALLNSSVAWMSTLEIAARIGQPRGIAEHFAGIVAKENASVIEQRWNRGKQQAEYRVRRLAKAGETGETPVTSEGSEAVEVTPDVTTPVAVVPLEVLADDGNPNHDGDDDSA